MFGFIYEISIPILVENRCTYCIDRIYSNIGGPKQAGKLCDTTSNNCETGFTCLSDGYNNGVGICYEKGKFIHTCFIQIWYF